MERIGQFANVIERNVNSHWNSDISAHKVGISRNDFDDYKSRVEMEYTKYEFLKKLNGSFEDHLDDMHLNKNLCTCYASVPCEFF